MGKLRNVGIAEQRVYDDPQNPANSDYDVALPITVPDAVIDPGTGKKLSETISEQAAGIAAAKEAASKHNHDDRYYTETEVDSKLSSKANTSHTHTTVNGHTVQSNVPANAKFTDTTYGYASASASGLVSTGSQTFAGNKTFNGQLIPNGASSCGTAQARKLASGTAAATTSNCPAGAWYGQYE